MTSRLEKGDTAPDFSLTTATGETFTLSEHLGKTVIVYFYPAAMTPGCTTQACDFRDNYSRLQAAGYDVIGISPDQPEKLQRFAERDNLTFPLGSDPDKSTIEAYGAWGEKNMYGKKSIGLIRSTVVVGPDGKVVQANYNVRAKGHVDRILSSLDVPAER